MDSRPEAGRRGAAEDRPGSGGICPAREAGAIRRGGGPFPRGAGGPGRGAERPGGGAQEEPERAALLRLPASAAESARAPGPGRRIAELTEPDDLLSRMTLCGI